MRKRHGRDLIPAHKAQLTTAVGWNTGWDRTQQTGGQGRMSGGCSMQRHAEIEKPSRR